MWDLWWTNWHWNRFFSEFFGSSSVIIPPLLSILAYHLGDDQLVAVVRIFSPCHELASS
jgi:hypothetical protein